MNKKKIALIILSVVIVSVGIIVAVRIQKEKEMDFGEFSERFEQAAEEVLGEDVKKISKTELAATLTYGDKTDEDRDGHLGIFKLIKKCWNAGQILSNQNTQHHADDNPNSQVSLKEADTCIAISFHILYPPFYKFKTFDMLFLMEADSGTPCIGFLLSAQSCF